MTPVDTSLDLNVFSVFLDSLSPAYDLRNLGAEFAFSDDIFDGKSVSIVNEIELPLSKVVLCQGLVSMEEIGLKISGERTLIATSCIAGVRKLGELVEDVALVVDGTHSLITKLYSIYGLDRVDLNHRVAVSFQSENDIRKYGYGDNLDQELSDLNGRFGKFPQVVRNFAGSNSDF